MMSTDPRLELTQQVREAMSAAISQVVNGRAADLPPLHWSPSPRPGGVLTGHVHAGYPDEDAAGIAARWAARFKLTQPAAAMTGTVEYVGAIEGQPVEVWAISDRAAWDTRVAELCSRREQIEEAR